MKKILALASLLIVSSVIKADVLLDKGIDDEDANSISGKVIDTNNRAVPYANVVAVNKSDSSYIAGTITNDGGLFSLEVSDSTMLKVSCVGYEDLYSGVQSSPMTIVLHEAAVSLDEVTVKGYVPTYKMTAEGLLTNVEGTVLSKLGTAEDVLKRVPSVIKKNDSWEIFGKGAPLIYLNGHILENLSELDNIKSSDIKSVTVVYNPGAAYSSSVNAVIKIKTVRKAGDGFSFDARSTYRYNKYSSCIEQLNTNYRHNGLNVFANYEYYSNGYLQDATFEQTTHTETLWRQHNYSYDSGREAYHYILGGLSYDFNENHSVGAKYSVVLTSVQYRDGYFGSEVTADGAYYDSLLSSNRTTDTDKPIHRINAYYTGKIGKTSVDLNTDWYYGHTLEHDQQYEESKEYAPREIISNSSVKSSVAAVRLVLETPLLGGTLCYGAEGTAMRRNDDYEINNTEILPNSYNKLTEQTVCPFIEYRRSTPVGDFSAGLRYEYVRFKYYANGEYVPEQSRIFRDYFPSVSYSKQIGKTSWQLAYSVKTRRPGYSQLRSGISYANKFTLQSGNPLLCSQTDHVVSLTGVWNCMQFMLNYADSRDAIIYWGEQMPDNDAVTVIRYKNENSIKALTAYINAAPKIGIWSPQFSVGMIKPWFTLHANTGTYGMNKPIFTGNIKNVLSLPWGITANIDFAYQSKGNVQNAELLKNQYILDLGLRKSFLKDAFTVEVRGEDLLHQTWDSHVVYNDRMEIQQLCRRGTRRLEVTLRYKFNTVRSKYKGTGAGNSVLDRL